MKCGSIMQHTRYRWASVVCRGGLLGAMVMLNGCTKKAPPRPVMVRPVKVAPAVLRDAPIYVDSFGTLTAFETVDLKAQVSGKIASCRFTEGQFVTTDAVLYTIETDQYVAAVGKAAAALQQSAVDLKRKLDSYQRNKPLLDQGAISTDSFDQIVTDYHDAQAAYQLNRAQLDMAQIDLDHCMIESPVNGYTGKRLVDAGNIVPANTGPALVNIKRVDPLLLDFTVPEKYFFSARAAISSNKVHALLTPQGAEGSVFTGVVDFIENTVDDKTGTIAMRASVPNSQAALWAGQFVTVRFVIGVQKNAVMVPYEAVQNGQQGFYLFVVTADKKAELRVVKVGLRVDDLIVIETGVAAGETVVTVGQMGLAPGVPVALLGK